VKKRTPAEVIRRLRLGNLRTLFRYRWRGPRFPQGDDAGLEDLRWLLMVISTGPNAEIKMRNEIRVWAPWMKPPEADLLIDELNNTPLQDRKLKAEYIGAKLGVTNAERELLRIWTIYPCDMTPEAMQEWRKAKERARKRRRYQQSRAEYLAKHSISQQQPWIALGIKRRAYYYRLKSPPNCTSQGEVILETAPDQPVQSEQAQPPQEQAIANAVPQTPKRPRKRSVRKPNANGSRAMRTDLCNRAMRTDLRQRNGWMRNSRTADERLDPNEIELPAFPFLGRN
jgi:hypothetical protein